MSSIQTLLVVCAGNICRSPMAEAVFRDRLSDRPRLAHVQVSSAGTIALSGNSATADAVDVTRERFGLDIAGHRARPFTHDLEADLVLAVDRWTTDQVRAIDATAPVEMLGDFVGSGEEVEDPYGGPVEAYTHSAQQLERLIAAAVDRLEAEVTRDRPDR